MSVAHLRTVLCLLALVVGVATTGTDAYEAMSRHSFYTDEAEEHLLFVDVDNPQASTSVMTADVLL